MMAMSPRTNMICMAERSELKNRMMTSWIPKISIAKVTRAIALTGASTGSATTNAEGVAGLPFISFVHIA